MKFLQLLEKAWLYAAAISIVVMLYNAVAHRHFDQQIYFPLFCAMFCGLIYFNVKSQRKFREKMDEREQKHNPKTNSDLKP